jgi:phosphate-selective porin OprO/OprP
MLKRQESIHAPGGGQSVPRFSSCLTWVLAALLAFGGSVGAKAETDADSVAALRQLIEQQNRKLDELNEKVRLLEDREKQRDAALAGQRLPAIVIDTNGVPIATVAASSGEREFDGNQTNKLVPRLSAGENGFAFQSADTNCVLAFHGLVQADSHTFFNDNPQSQANAGFLLRRARPILDGTLFHDFDFRLAPDFGWPSVQLYDAYIDYHYSPALQVRAGKFKGPVGLENLQTDAATSFNEKSLASDLVPMRNLGFELSGELAAGTLNWAAGIYNGVGDGSLSANSVANNEPEFGGRLFWQPFKNAPANPLQGLGFGVGASYSDVSSNSAVLPSTLDGSLPGFLTAGQQQFFAYNPLYGSVVADGAHWRFSPQAYYYLGPFGVQGEYVISDQSVMNNLTMARAALQNTAWQVSAQWVLTGEKASFTGLTPDHPFNARNGQWGAWQLVARYSALDIDNAAFNSFSDPATSARSAAGWSVGINWWLNRNVRMLTSFSHTTFQGGGGVNQYVPSTTSAPATVTAQDENALFTRIQIVF